MLENVLSAHDLSKTYRDPAGDVVALKNFSYSFVAGKVTAIMGPSGSGKSTLLNLLAGLDVPSDGQVVLGHQTQPQAVSALSEAERSELRLREFGFVFQSYNLVAVLSAQQNVAFPMGLAGVNAAARRERALALLARFGLAHRADHLPHKLSGGERQRVSVARALANSPSVVFADEPTGNLDKASGAVVLQALREVAEEGRTVIVVTHDPRVVEKVDVVLALDDGVLRSERVLEFAI